MDFKCKNCNSTKYRQISSQVKQCEECGMQIQSKGVVDPKVLDITEEPDNNAKKYEEINSSYYSNLFNSVHPFRIKQRTRPNGTIEYYID